MNEKTKKGLEILQSAVLLGIAGDLLLRETPWGLNVFLWIGLLVTAMIAITVRRKSENWTPQTIALHGALLFFAATYVWRDAMALKMLNFLAILTILAVLVLPSLKLKAQATGLFHYGVSAIYVGLSAAFAPFFLLIDDIKWKSTPNKGLSKYIISVIRGLAIATPILFVFGALFMAADAAFEGIVQNTFNIDTDKIFTHSLLIGFLTWIVAGYLRAAMFDFPANGSAVSSLDSTSVIKEQVPSVTAHISEDTVKKEDKADTKETVVDRLESSAKSQDKLKDKKSKDKKQSQKSWNWRNFDNSVLPQFFTLGVIETSIVLGLINLLFFAFVIVQVPYLFGGMDLVQATPDFKLAEYARRGFGELVAVSMLVLPILLLSHWLLRKDKPINEKIYRVLAGIQIGLLFVIMISAMQRLLLYTGNLGYGLTTDRFYPMAFMFFLALVFAWFALTVLRGARHQFAWGTLWIALFVLGTLHVMNPDDFILRTNVRLMQEGREYAVHYNNNLSNDSIPVFFETFDETFPKVKDFQVCSYKYDLYHRLSELNEQTGFRSWNYSRWRARNLLEQNKEKFADYQQCWDEQRKKQEKEFPSNY